MQRVLAVPALMVLVPAFASAQRVIDLTGTPAATIAEPFSKISGVQELASGLVVATDNMDVKVALVDFARGSVRQIGAKGRGPNEYQYPSPPIAAARGAYVFDTYQKRAILIGPNGAITGMTMLPDGPASRPRGSDAKGRVYFEGSDFDQNSGGFSDSLPVVRWDPATQNLETVGRVWGGGRVRIQWNGGPASFARAMTPFPHMDAWVPLPDGRIAMLRHDPFRIDLTDGTAAGAVKRGASIVTTPVPITARERAWYREGNTGSRMSAVTTTGGSGPQQRGPQWEDASFPETFPPFIAADVTASPAGEIWIPRSFTSADRTRQYDIYDGDAKLIATARLNANARVVGFGARAIYVARVNPDDDLVYLERYSR
jgi:hypothetical protein